MFDNTDLDHHNWCVVLAVLIAKIWRQWIRILAKKHNFLEHEIYSICWGQMSIQSLSQCQLRLLVKRCMCTCGIAFDAVIHQSYANTPILCSPLFWMFQLGFKKVYFDFECQLVIHIQRNQLLIICIFEIHYYLLFQKKILGSLGDQILLLLSSSCDIARCFCFSDRDNID